jgi:hypothetical protein
MLWLSWHAAFCWASALSGPVDLLKQAGALLKFAAVSQGAVCTPDA